MIEEWEKGDVNVPIVGQTTILDDQERILFQTDLIEGYGSDGMLHNEKIGLDKVLEWLQANAQKGGVYHTHIVSEEVPCRYCQGRIVNWFPKHLNYIIDPLGADADLHIWVHSATGEVNPANPPYASQNRK